MRAKITPYCPGHRPPNLGAAGAYYQHPVAAHISAGRRFLMAQDQKKPAPGAAADDSLLNLKFAQAEADLAQKTGGLGPTTNEYVTSDEDAEITAGEGPIDKQGQRRGVTDPTDEGSTAGSHS